MFDFMFSCPHVQLTRTMDPLYPISELNCALHPKHTMRLPMSYELEIPTHMRIKILLEHEKIFCKRCPKRKANKEDIKLLNKRKAKRKRYYIYKED